MAEVLGETEELGERPGKVPFRRPLMSRKSPRTEHGFPLTEASDGLPEL
jgi:hypothetical protein